MSVNHLDLTILLVRPQVVGFLVRGFRPPEHETGGKCANGARQYREASQSVDIVVAEQLFNEPSVRIVNHSNPTRNTFNERILCRLTAKGRWVQDREFGLQFRADMLNSTVPTTREGIEKYLGSGMVKGIGPIYAKKLVGKFGEKIFDIIEQESARLEDVDGIGPKRRQRIKDAWAEQKVIRNIMVFLHSNGVSTSRAVRI